jgi:hypothetical protein
MNLSINIERFFRKILNKGWGEISVTTLCGKQYEDL